MTLCYKLLNKLIMLLFKKVNIKSLMLQTVELYTGPQKEAISGNKLRSANEPGTWAFILMSLVYLAYKTSYFAYKFSEGSLNNSEMFVFVGCSTESENVSSGNGSVKLQIWWLHICTWCNQQVYWCGSRASYYIQTNLNSDKTAW